MRFLPASLPSLFTHFWNRLREQHSRNRSFRTHSEKLKAHLPFLQLEPLEDRTLLNAGSLDLTFGNGGIVTTDLPVQATIAERGAGADIETLEDGRFLVLHAIDPPDGSDPVSAVSRYHADGSVDTTFGDQGLAIVDVSASYVGSSATMTLQPDGKIVVAGNVTAFDGNNLNKDFSLIRFHADGSLDTTFGNQGFLTTELGSSSDTLSDVTVQSDGKIVAVGSVVSSGTGRDVALVRYHTDGSLDNSFGTAGIVITDGGNSKNDHATNVFLQPDGRIVIVGNINPYTGLIRYNSDGSIDTSAVSSSPVSRNKLDK